MPEDLEQSIYDSLEADDPFQSDEDLGNERNPVHVRRIDDLADNIVDGAVGSLSLIHI